MTEPTVALPGTALLSPTRNTAFYDRYQRQYAQTLAWLQRALQDHSRQRDQERSSAAQWLAERRHTLAQTSGFAQIEGKATGVEIQPLAAGASSYQIDTVCGLRLAGLLWEPATATPTGLVIVGDDRPHQLAGQVAAYRANGLRVVMPCLAGARRTYADHPERKWYFFTDDELLHLLFFVVGGSLAGLEAAELVTTAQTLAQQGENRLPVALDLRGRHLLSAALAAAMGVGLEAEHPAPVDLLLLDDGAGLLDRQQDDVRLNTIWGYHRQVDGLTLLQMAQATNFLFVESLITPSAWYSRACLWFDSFSRETSQAAPPAGHGQRVIGRLVAPSPAQLAQSVADALANQTAARDANPPQSAAAMIDVAAWENGYRRALDNKVAYLETLHTQAQEQRRQRYDLATLTPAEYRARIEASLARVAGPPLPACPDRAPQTRRILRQPAYDLYEVVLASVALAQSGGAGTQDAPGVEVAGYLLVPTSALPAPAVICQHGLGGRPDALAGFDDRFEGQWVYDQFARRLAEKGYVVFVPFMNWGWPTTAMRDRLVKHAYALGFAPNRFEVAQLHAIVDFLQSRPEVIADRIAFYGLSYGGHASLWLCAHEPRLAAVVTAGHFNDWQTKLTSTEISPPQERPSSYLTVDEGLDMFNYNVLNELGHAELATRFAPRPHFVENGLRDSVTPTAWVEREFARLQRVFAWLGAAGQAELEHFPGPHRVWAEGSFHFLERHLRTNRAS